VTAQQTSMFPRQQLHCNRETVFSTRAGPVRLILSSEKMLHKDYDGKGSVANKISGRDPQGSWRQDELIGGKPPVVK
jgi:hypothetical protein